MRPSLLLWLALGLQACYPAIPASQWRGDQDGDGVSLSEGDCNDADPNSFPGNNERSDGLDNDCDGVANCGGEGIDADGDGHLFCADCDDTNPDFTARAAYVRIIAP
jgi:hypothetical protein